MYFTLCIFSAGLRTEEPFAMLSGTSTDKTHTNTYQHADKYVHTIHTYVHHRRTTGQVGTHMRVQAQVHVLTHSLAQL